MTQRACSVLLAMAAATAGLPGCAYTVQRGCAPDGVLSTPVAVPVAVPALVPAPPPAPEPPAALALSPYRPLPPAPRPEPEPAPQLVRLPGRSLKAGPPVTTVAATAETDDAPRLQLTVASLPPLAERGPRSEERRTEEKAPPPEEPIVAALRCYLARRPADAVERLKRYDPVNQDVLARLLPLAARLSEGSLRQANPKELAAVAEGLQALSEPLRPRSALVIEKLCFCREVKEFGVYDPWPTDRAFAAGAGGRDGELVRAYVELRNFTCESVAEGHRTRLASVLVITDAQGKEVWRRAFPARADVSRAARRDYYLNCYFCVPAALAPGTYTLTVRVEDEPTKRSAEQALAFRVQRMKEDS